MDRKDTRDEGLRLVIARMGGSLSELARKLGVSRQAVSSWRSVPVERAKDVASITGIPLETLRPDLWSPRITDPPPRPPAGLGG